jgi:hypothetical protein
VRFTAVNVQVVSGSGSTAGAVNGRGNLVIGYDEAPNSQSGSHNLVLGSHQAYTSYGSIVAGSHNFANGQYSAVLGEGNSVTGAYATVTGGIFNHAADRLSAISGGCKNVTGSGGVGNFCSGPGLESVSGGYSNVAAGPISSISGGYANQANGSRSSVAGGEFNIAGDQFSFIGAGCDNLTGPGSNIIVGCDPGAEAILGGFAQHVTTQDGTYPAGP